LLRGKDETPDIEDLGSVLRDSSIQTLRLPTSNQEVLCSVMLIIVNRAEI
jgi:hypothetical protein